MTSAHRRGMVTREVNPERVKRGLPTAGAMTMHVASNAHVPSGRRSLWGALERAPRRTDTQRRWTVGKTTGVTTKATSLRWKRNGVAAAKNCDPSTVDQRSTGEKEY